MFQVTKLNYKCFAREIKWCDKMESKTNVEVYYKDSFESARSELWFKDPERWIGFVENADFSKSPEQSYITLYEQDGGEKPKAIDEDGNKLYKTHRISVGEALNMIKSFMTLFKIDDYDKRFVFFFLRDIKNFYKVDSKSREKIENIISDLDVNTMYLSHSKWLW